MRAEVPSPFIAAGSVSAGSGEGILVPPPAGFSLTQIAVHPRYILVWKCPRTMHANNPHLAGERDAYNPHPLRERILAPPVLIGRRPVVSPSFGYAGTTREGLWGQRQVRRRREVPFRARAMYWARTPAAATTSKRQPAPRTRLGIHRPRDENPGGPSAPAKQVAKS